MKYNIIEHRNSNRRDKSGKPGVSNISYQYVRAEPRAIDVLRAARKAKKSAKASIV